jgi:hypothetical protein
MSKDAKLGFKMQKIRIPLSEILPIRQIIDPEKKITRYRAIVTSIKDAGLIEPLVVFKKNRLFLLMDGHLRHAALLELGETEADCILSTDDESFTYNARVSRITSIQEHVMIAKAVKSGVSPERIAASLNLQLAYVHSVINLLQGIHRDAVEILKEKPITHKAVALLKRVKGSRQIEMAELMTSANNFSAAYIQALIMGTPQDQMIRPDKPKVNTKLTLQEQARMEHEMAMLERDFKASEDDYGKNMLNLTFVRGYIKKLLGNAKVTRFLASRHPDVFTEFESVSRIESM